MKHLIHENIVRIYGCEENGDCLEIFMEYCRAGSIAAMLKRFRKFQPAIIRSYTQQMLSGIAFLHSRGIVHRDIKGDNLLLGENDKVKITDFGYSKIIHHTTRRQGDVCQTMLGTPYWMAPEIIQRQEGADGYGSKVDIWSSGIVVIEMLGRRPWEFEEGNHAFVLLYKIAESEGPPDGMPKSHEPCNRHLRSFLHKCFIRVPADRPSAAALLDHEFVTCP
eukprot:gene5685-20900_t